MKGKKKIGAILLAVAVGVSAMSMGFAAWQTDITGSGAVSASGSWDVQVTDAAITSISSGTSVDSEAVDVEPTGSVVVYPVKLGVRSLDNAYALQIDDLNGEVVDMTAEELAEYEYYFNLTYGSGSSYYFVSGAKAEKTSSFMMKITDFESVKTKEYSSYTSAVISTDNNDNGASAGKIVGYAILRMWGGSTSSNVTPNIENLKATYVSAQNEINNGETRTIYPATISEDGTDVTFAAVSFAVPDAWASYSLTITNNGTVDANLSNAEIRLDTEDADQLTLDAPDLSGEVLAPGESCTITVVVKALDNGTGTLDAEGTLVIKLPYAQIAVEEAPAPSHTHN